jgi:GNAT superfamily N-acetyltransferase
MLRPATVDDVQAIAAFQIRCWFEAYRDLIPPDYLNRMTVHEREARWNARLRSRRFRVALAEVDGAIIGVAGSHRAWVIGVPALELKTLYVDAAWHGRGVAAALTSRVIGAAPAHLWVFEANARARAFYRKQGFQPDGHHQTDRDTGVREIRMVRR